MHTDYTLPHTSKTLLSSIMTAPSLTALPMELLAEIIPSTMPEGFESLAVSCKTLYSACAPFIKRHNQFRSQFHDFSYHGYLEYDGPLSPRNPSAYDLIKHIAEEPVVARYIRIADFFLDTIRYAHLGPSPTVPLPDSGPIVDLFANSSYLKESGLDWREYHALIQDDFEAYRLGRKRTYYSQHAAAFLLTLLPNATSIKLPFHWKSTESSDKLLSAIARKAITEHDATWEGKPPSLAQVVYFQPYNPQLHHPPCFGFDQVIPFLALPRLRWFDAAKCSAVDGDSIAKAPQDLYACYGANLEEADLYGGSFSVAAIADFLRHTPRLKRLSLNYTYRRYRVPNNGTRPRDWDVVQYVAAIEKEAGNHLEELKLNIWDLRAEIPTGKVSMCGFKRLRKLELSLDIARHNIARGSRTCGSPVGNETLTAHQRVIELQQLTDCLVPGTVSELVLRSDNNYEYERALGIMFWNFSTRKDTWLPALKHIYIEVPRQADASYEEQCAKVAAEAQKVEVEVHMGEDSYEWLSYNYL